MHFNASLRHQRAFQDNMEHADDVSKLFGLNSLTLLALL